MWIASHVVVRQYELIHRIRIVAAKPVIPVIARAAKLCLAGGTIDQAFVGANTKVAAANVYRLKIGLERRTDSTAAIPVCSVDPAIEPPTETIQTVLLITLGETREKNLP